MNKYDKFMREKILDDASRRRLAAVYRILLNVATQMRETHKQHTPDFDELGDLKKSGAENQANMPESENIVT